MAFKIYSIESRKGGVGKTTVALNLASILVKRGPVLLLDCDITGTSIANPVKNSSFWREETNVLAFSVENGGTKDINLLEYFLKQYIKGNGNAREILKPERLKASKVNIIGSFMYGTPIEAAQNSSWLMDELHSYWMVEFIQQIVKEFDGLYADKNVHVIIDNSPGYTCFNQSLHDYMFDIGPVDAKFVLVSTLDIQDLQANMEVVAEIHNSISNRTNVVDFYKKKETDQEDDASDAETKALIEDDDNIKAFFFDLIEIERLREVYSKNYKTEDYLALVLNKVPQSIYDNDTEIAYDEIVGKWYDLFKNATGALDENRPQNVVYYDEAIVYQYYLKYIRGRFGNRPNNVSYWSRRLREMRQQAAEVTSLKPVAAMLRLNTYYEGLQTSLNQRGYSQIARQLARTWAPIYAIDMLKTKLSGADVNQWYRASEVSPQRMKELLNMWNNEQLMDLQRVMGERSPDFILLSDLIDYLVSYAGIDDVKLRPDLMILVSVLLYVFTVSFLERKYFDQEKALRHFSWSEYKETSYNFIIGDILKKPIVVSPELILNIDGSHGFIRMFFFRMYTSFCYTILRLIDQQEDFNFLLDAVSLYVPSIPVMSFPKEMTDYISEVVYRKSIEPNTHYLVDIRARSYIMKNMQDVLRDNILKTWK